MRLLKAPRDTPIQVPSVCFLCERAPREEEDVVDVERNLFAPGTNLNGRKYVCADCVADVAHLFGFISPSEAQKFKDAKAQAEADRDTVFASFDLSKQMAEAVERLAVVRTIFPFADVAEPKPFTPPEVGEPQVSPEEKARIEAEAPPETPSTSYNQEVAEEAPPVFKPKKVPQAKKTSKKEPSEKPVSDQ